MQQGTHTYFLSDFHLGIRNAEESRLREIRICRFLDQIKTNARTIYLVGDIFDFWFEYKTVVPKGYVRLLGKLAELKDAGIEIIVLTGNHDLWMNDYFETELNIPVHHKPIEVSINHRKFFIGHGDGLGPGDTGFKVMKKIFTNPICQWLYRWVHPDVGIRLALFWSRRSRIVSDRTEEKFLGNDKEWLVQFCLDKLKTEHFDYFIFGHRHLPIDLQLTPNSKYHNLGDWLKYDSYAVFDGSTCELRYWKNS